MQGTLTPQLTVLFPLEQVAEAHKTLERGHAKGKIVLGTIPGDLPVRAGKRFTRPGAGPCGKKSIISAT